MSDLDTSVRAWRSTTDDVLRLAADLGDEEWARPTDLPGWTAQDVLAHLAAVEHEIATGEGPTGVAPIPGRPMMSWWTEAGVAERRGRTAPDLIEELRSAVDARSAHLAQHPPTDPAAPADRTPGHIPWDNATLFRNRVVDVWVHGQDIRRAVGRPGSLDTAGAEFTASVFVSSWPYLLGKRAGAPAGTTLAVIVDGVRTDVAVGESGRAAITSQPAAEPTVSLVMTREELCLLCAGRRAAGQLAIRVEGDADLAARLLANPAVTP